MPPGDGGGSNGGGCSVGGSVMATTAIVNILMPIIILLGFGLITRFRRISR